MKTGFRALVVVGVLSAGTAACASNGGAPATGDEPPQPIADRSDTPTPGVHGLRGCWELLVENEAARDSLETWLSGETLPRMVELDSIPTGGGTAARGPCRAFSWHDGRRETSPFSEWQPMEGDSIRVQRTGALAGLMLRMAPAADDLAGSLIVFTDVAVPGDSGRREVEVAADRGMCP